MPQCAIAQVGSAFAMRSNCGWASSYQKSWSNATPRLKGARTDAEQDTEKDTSPSRSPGGAAVRVAGATGAAAVGVAGAAGVAGVAGAAMGSAVNARRRAANFLMGVNCT